MKIEKNKLKWQCRRGMLELDVLFANYIDKYYDSLNSAELDFFVKLLANSDQDLFDWLMNKKQPKDPAIAKIILEIRNAKSSINI